MLAGTHYPSLHPYRPDLVAQGHIVTRILSFSWAVLLAVSPVGIAAAFVVTILASARKKWRLETTLVMWALVLAAIGAIAYNLHIIAGE